MRCRLYKRREKFRMKRKMDERLTLDDEQISRIKSNLHYTGCFFPVITECLVTFRAVTERRPCWNADPSGNHCKETLRAALSLVDLSIRHPSLPSSASVGALHCRGVRNIRASASMVCRLLRLLRPLSEEPCIMYFCSVDLKLFLFLLFFVTWRVL
jgi:hypothetical protein